MSPAIRLLTSDDAAALRTLSVIAGAEGFHFLDRLLNHLEEQNPPAAPDHFFLSVVGNAEVIAVGGVTPDPYLPEPGIGRIRHVYVHPEWRRMGIGRRLIRAIENRVRGIYPMLRLRTATSAGARFYEALGYLPVNDQTATHIRKRVA